MMNSDATEDSMGDNSHAIINGHLEVLFTLCKEQGISRSETESTLLYLLRGALFRSFDQYLNDDRQAVLNCPGGEELTKAYKLAMLHRENTPEFEQACQSWLLARCGAKLGEVVLAGTWSQPRQILIQNVKLHWMRDAALQDGMISLEGPTIYSKGVGVIANSITIPDSVHKSISKIEPSASLLRFCREHGIQVASSG
jgi:hypothetical protein